MKVHIKKTNQTRTLSYKGELKLLLFKLKINPETVIVTRSNEIITDDETIKDDDEIVILSVVSGG